VLTLLLLILITLNQRMSLTALVIQKLLHIHLTKNLLKTAARCNVKNQHVDKEYSEINFSY